MNFLYTNGYQEAAQLFSKESGISLSEDRNIEKRDLIRQAILSDQIDKAIGYVNEIDEKIFERNPKLLFKLRLQKFVCYIKENKVIEALAYGQEILAPSAKGNPDLMKELEKALGLIAFGIPENSPLAELVSPLYKLIIANDVNDEILKSEGQEKSLLTRMIKGLRWTEKRIGKNIAFPHYEFR